jgi:hypothetical protein
MFLYSLLMMVKFYELKLCTSAYSFDFIIVLKNMMNSSDKNMPEETMG